MTITLQEQDEALLLAEARRRGTDPAQFATAALRAGLAALATLPAPHATAASESESASASEVDSDDLAWWNQLTPEEQEAERTGLRRGLADINAGRTKPAEEVYARIRATYAHLQPAAAAEAA
jgi:predicted transcriptional regulator